LAATSAPCGSADGEIDAAHSAVLHNEMRQIEYRAVVRQVHGDHHFSRFVPLCVDGILRFVLGRKIRAVIKGE
jgi:hypothetical protein